MRTVTNKGKKSTRDTILHALKSSNQATVEELADVAKVSPVTVRHHLNALQAEGLIEVDSVRRKVGRPYYIYSLTESGHELFPHKYVRLTNRLLDELKATLPEEQVHRIFEGVVQNILEEHKGSFESLSFEERLSYLVSMLSEEGFLVKWEKRNGRYTLTEYGCPYYSIGEEHTEICGMDKSLMVTVLRTPVEQHTCMLQGDGCCQFTFTAAVTS